MTERESDTTDEFEQALIQAWPASKWVNVRVLVAFSGGPDSTALLRSLHNLQSDRTQLAAAHFNHRLRGAASDEDQAFTEELARRLGLEYYVQASTPGSIEMERAGQGTESAARAQRYEFLVRTAEQIGARYLVTAHTADDQIETVLHRIVRGTGLAGLAGIPKFRRAAEAVTIARPMLSIRRENVLQYLGRLQQNYCDDGANQQTCFTRNRIRHELLPLLRRDFNADVGEALLRLSRIADDAQDTLRCFAEQLVDQSTDWQPSKVYIDTTRLHASPLHLRREMFVVIWQRNDWPLQSMSFSEWQQLADLTEPTAQTRALNLPGDVRAVRDGMRLRLWREEGAD